MKALLALLGPLLLGSCGPSKPECEDVAARAWAIVAPVLEAHSACSVDADCLEAHDAPRCANSCGVILASEGVDALRAAIDKANREICDEYDGDGCVHPPPVPLCPYLGPPVCNNGKCGRPNPNSRFGRPM